MAPITQVNPVHGVELFPVAEYWWFYAIFMVFVSIVVALDLGVFQKEAHQVSFREALRRTISRILMALAFNVGFYFYLRYALPHNERLMALPGFDPAAVAQESALQFLAGYLVEQTLALDNIFVFSLVFTYFSIPGKYQARVLLYGIFGALLFRAIFISIGSLLMQFHWVVLAAGVFLIFTGGKMLFGGEEKIEPEKNPLIRLLRRFLPITPGLEAEHFFVRHNNRLFGTPLLVTLIVVEASDIVFALDSVPAIFGISSEPLIVFTSNVFAILGLRSMYFILADILERFHLLKYGVSLILVFVGLKMVWLNDLFGGEMPITWSLGIIFGVLGLSIVASLVVPKKPEAEHGP